MLIKVGVRGILEPPVVAVDIEANDPVVAAGREVQPALIAFVL